MQRDAPDPSVDVRGGREWTEVSEPLWVGSFADGECRKMRACNGVTRAIDRCG
jgi:hypothetical protein